MSEIVSLSQARKARSRAGDQARAAENRAKFGLTKAQKAAARTARTRVARLLDQARREP